LTLSILLSEVNRTFLIGSPTLLAMKELLGGFLICRWFAHAAFSALQCVWPRPLQPSLLPVAAMAATSLIGTYCTSGFTRGASITLTRLVKTAFARTKRSLTSLDSAAWLEASTTTSHHNTFITMLLKRLGRRTTAVSTMKRW
jgi:hypothetical protein